MEGHDDDATPPAPERMPALYIGHGAPTLVDDPVWPVELAAWARDLPRPRSILMVSAHWESQPLTVGATTPVPLVYDFYGFPERYYRTRYAAPGAPDLAASVAKLIRDVEPVAQAPDRGLDHGAYVPLTVMYPDADVPVLQMSLPDLDPEHLFAIGRRLAPLRDEGVLIIGSGFLTHGLPYVREYMAGKAGSTDLVDRLRPLGRRGAGRRRRRRPLRLPQPGPRHALRPPDRGALRSALRDPRRGGRRRRGARLPDRRLLVRPREAVVRRPLRPGAARRSAWRRRAQPARLSLTRLRSMKETLPGFSARRRMKYGYHCEP